MTAHYLSFRVGTQWYGLNVEQVVEVLPIMKLNELPVSSSDVLGLLTLRNNVIPVIDLRIRFGITDPSYKIDTPVIAVRAQDRIIGLMVDDADNVESVSDDMLINHQGEVFPYVAGVAKLSKGLLMLIDSNAVFFSVNEQVLKVN